MKTQELIDALAADNRRPLPGMQWQILAAATIGTLVSVAMFQAALGVRTDLGAALTTWRFDIKLAVLALGLAIAAVCCTRAARPQPRSLSNWAILFIVVVVATIASELAITPPELWREKMIGTNAMVCLSAIPALAVAPMLALIFAVRAGAPASPAWSGALVGALSAAIAAAMYGLHCFDDSPLFVAVWYSLAAVPVVAIGAFAGSRILRW